MYSVVIPLKNEEENVELLLQEVSSVMEGLKEPWELICIDDGSSDGTAERLEEQRRRLPQLRVLKFKRNFGQSTALAAGFAAASCPIVITLDGDLQNDPADIPQLLEELQDYDLVVGWRSKRRDPWQKRAISRLSNAVRSRLCSDGVHDTGCSLKVYRLEALKQIKLYHGMHRFLPALFLIEGFRVKEVPVNHRARSRGKTKYHFFNRLVGPIVDMLVVYWMRKRAIRYEFK